MKNFYTAKEAQERLGVDKNGFYYMIRKGTIKPVTLPGRKHGVYPRSEVDKFAAAIKTTIEQYEREISVFRVASVDDMPEEYALDVSLYGRKTATVETRIAKLERNPKSDYVLMNEGEIVGHINFHPVDPQALQKFLSGEIEFIAPDMVLPFMMNMPLDVLFVVMSVKTGFPPDVAKHYGLRLIAGSVEVFRQLGESGVEIQHVYATSRTTTGIRICRKLGMQEKPVPHERGRFSFSLDVQTTDALLAREYRHAFAEYKGAK
ncbi:MAG: helix-turn-helix domain-containing protein [Ktedonobacteraceae bacterium]|jgi:hypothetical protein|nr:helix-turn-helix domain-containing protein [Ktedonobacteraceae bacterium]